MKKGYFFILIATIAFSSMEVVLKLIAGEVNPVQLTLARFSIGFVFLAPVAVYTLKKRSKRLDRKSVAYFALLGRSIRCPSTLPSPPWWRSCSAATQSLLPFLPS